MFSHLCRACMVELLPARTVPLFKKYQDVILSRICSAISLSVEEDDNLGRNVCKTCADSIMKFYTFHLMYTKSNRKLRRMLCQSTDNKNDIELNVPDVDCIVQTSLGIVDSKHKCRKCLAGFNTRSLLRIHIRQVHRGLREDSLNNTTMLGMNDTSNSEHRWKCSHCTSRFRTRDLKNAHQKECRQLNSSRAINELTEIKESEFIDYNDFVASEVHSGSETDNDIGDDNSLLPQREFKCEVNSKFGPIDELNGDNLPGIGQDPTSHRKLHQSTLHSEPEDKLFPHVSIKQEQLDVDDLHLKTESERQEYENTMAMAQEGLNFRWKCKTCLVVFETRELLRIHRRSHLGVRKLAPVVRTGWNCNICDAVLASRDKVRLHKEANHPKEKRERRCNDETKNWGDVGQYECELCNKLFISKSKIRKHMDVHKNKDRPKRLCTICGLELCSTYNLNNHIRTVHRRERKFHCRLCERRFSHSHHLKTHMNRHEGIRPFQCEQCVKSFFDKTTLREHVKSVHLNLKAYACRICARTFNRSGNMRAHMLKTHHLGDLTGVQCAADNSRSINGPSSAYESDDSAPRFFPNNLGEPFRTLMKSTNH